MTYDDLTNYTDGFEPALNNVFNVGWLDGEADFPTGNCKSEHIDKLKELAYGNNPFSACFRVSRGFSSCKVCDGIATTKYDGEKKIIGSFLMLIPSINAGEYFVVPSTVIHFIEQHRYIPPNVFIDSLEYVDLMLKFDAENIMNDLMGN